MSHIASINVHYETSLDISVPEIIDMFISKGWSLNDFGHISLRPLGDKDDFSWVQLELDQKEELYRIIEKKVEVSEDPAVVLMWGETETGAVTTFFPNEKRINFLLMSGRIRYSEMSDWTDVSWYLPHILRALETNSLGVSQIEFTEEV
ncbi:MAG: hypothetical protein AB9888_00130 [Bacteroidales bacterium]